MHLLLLGPLEVRSDEGPTPLPGAAERALLARLGVSVGRSVPVATLIDDLWSESTLPLDPSNALQLRVSKLRRALQNVGHDVLVRDSGGYRLEIPPQAVDTHWFVDLLRRARAEDNSAADDEQRTRSLGFFDDAFALWRGDALAELLTQPWAEAEAGRLGALRQRALVERSELALALGLHADVVDQLAPLLARTPTDEPMAAVLMAAHYGKGQQVAALDVYQHTRTALDDDLGVEPSGLLRRMHQRVLQQDPTLSAAREHTRPPRTAALPPVARSHQPGDPPSEVTPEGDRPSLPTAVEGLIGRVSEVAAAQELLATSRLLSLVGPGGAGKTSLALEVARRVQHDHPDGAWLVRLAAVSDPSQVAQAVAEALAVPVEGAAAGVRASSRLQDYLATRRLLLVLDNCEHVVDAVAALVDSLLRTCPHVRVLTTSREALAVPGEVQLPVPPLLVPPTGASAAEARDFPAVQLLLARGRAVRPGLDVDLDEEQVLALAEVARALDGIPLALELAAVRLSTLSPTELDGRLRSGLPVLANGPRTAEARQRTLRATMDWSYDLLGDAERAAFEVLSVFRGGWTLDAAEHLLADVPGSEWSSGSQPDDEALDLLSRLVEQSLVLVVPGRPTRYRMLEPLRQYGADRLARLDGADQVASAHAAYFAELADRAAPGLHGRGQREWLRRLQVEQANLRAALVWLTAEPDRVDRALSLAGALGWYWHLGRHVEGREVLAKVSAMPGGSPLARARAQQAVSLVERPRACLVHPSPVCRAAAEESLRLFTSEGRRDEAAVSRLLLAVEGVNGDAGESARLLADAESWFSSRGDRWGLGVIAFVRMETELKAGREAEARRQGETAAEVFRGVDDPWGLSAVLYHLGWGLSQFGQYADAVSVLQEAVDVASSADLHNTAQWAVVDQGIALLHLGDTAAAADRFARADAAARDTGDRVGTVLAAYGRGLRALLQRDWPAALDLLRTAQAGFERLGTPVYVGAALLGLARCQEELEPSRAGVGYTAVAEVGRSAGEPGLSAAANEGLAQVAAAGGDLTSARRLVAAAHQIRREAHRPPTPTQQLDLDRLHRLLEGRRDS